jgi:hypothetical protein
MVPAFSLPRAVRASTRPLAEARGATLQDRRWVTERRVAFAAVHRRHHWRVQGRRRCCTATWSPTCCSREAWQCRSSRSAKGPREQLAGVCALPLYHIFALTDLLHAVAAQRLGR